MALVLELADTDLPEMMLIEMQGDLVPDKNFVLKLENEKLAAEIKDEEERKNNPERAGDPPLQLVIDPVSGHEIGQYTVDKNGNPNIIMGNSTIVGVFQDLKKPLTICRKTSEKRQCGTRMDSVCKVEGVIKKKAFFCLRPSIHVPKELIKKRMAPKAKAVRKKK